MKKILSIFIVCDQTQWKTEKLPSKLLLPKIKN